MEKEIDLCALLNCEVRTAIKFVESGILPEPLSKNSESIFFREKDIRRVFKIDDDKELIFLSKMEASIKLREMGSIHSLDFFVNKRILPRRQLKTSKGSKMYFLKSDVEALNQLKLNLLVFDKDYDSKLNKLLKIRENNSTVALRFMQYIFGKTTAEKLMLSEMDFKVLRYYFGFYDDNYDLIQWNIDEMAAAWNYTPERIRQFKERAIRRLYYSSRIESIREEMKNDLEYVPAAQLNKVLSEMEILRDELSVLKMKYAKYAHLDIINPLSEKDLKIRTLLLKKLDDCDLSIRALNTLKAADMEFVGDLVAFNKMDLFQLRNFGKKNMSELEELVNGMGINFGMDVKKIGFLMMNER